jgi:hypothetical protein
MSASVMAPLAAGGPPVDPMQAGLTPERKIV